MQGIHLVGDLYQCGCSPKKLIQAQSALAKCVAKCEEQGLTVIGHSVYGFENKGYTLAILLAESHFTIHTWPENYSVAMDVYVCNFSQDNTQKARNLAKWVSEYFQSKDNQIQEIQRGDVSAG